VAAQRPIDEDAPWPRVHSTNGHTVTLHLPQVEQWTSNWFRARAAIAVKPATARKELLGVVWLEAQGRVDRSNRLVTLDRLEITKGRFSEATDEGSNALAIAQITVAQAQGDVAPAERLAHALRGVAGNIGAKPAQTAAGTLEKLIRHRAEAPAVESAMQQVTAAPGPLLTQLRMALSASAAATPGPAATPAAADPAQTREAAAQLVKLLSEFDPGAVDVLEAHHAALRPLFPDDAWPQFESLVQNYAFADAQAKLEERLKNLPAA
jgi:HPt (histidine-containing phosphotransfer) domain-containing protein